MAEFGDLIAENIPRLRRYARALTRDSHLADDLVQDCLERAWAKRALWRDRGDIRAWLFTILHNVYANAARRHNRRPREVSIDAAPEPGVPSSQEANLFLLDLENCLAALSDEHREVLLLVGLEQLSYEQTATILELPVGTVMSRLSRARSRLREMLAESNEPVLRRIK